MFKKNSFLIISVLIHLIVIYVLAQSVLFPAELDTPAKKPDVIQATLIFDFPLPPPEIPVEVIEKIAEETPKSAELEEKLPTETPEENQIEPIAEPEVQTILIKPQPQSQSLPPKIEEKLEPTKETNEILSIEKNETPTPDSTIRAPSTNMAKRHLNSFQQQQQNSMAEQASRYYQQRKNSPIIDDEVKNPYMSEDEKFRDSLKVRADCSSTNKKITAALLGLLGGGIECSKPPPINGFIQNRINKESLLPGQHQKEDQQLPQSVVIKKQP